MKFLTNKTRTRKRGNSQFNTFYPSAEPQLTLWDHNFIAYGVGEWNTFFPFSSWCSLWHWEGNLSTNGTAHSSHGYLKREGSNVLLPILWLLPEMKPSSVTLRNVNALQWICLVKSVGVIHSRIFTVVFFSHYCTTTHQYYGEIASYKMATRLSNLFHLFISVLLVPVWLHFSSRTPNKSRPVKEQRPE